MFEKLAGCPSFATLERLLGSLQPDVIVVATPGPTHVEVIAATTAIYSPKVILCEKPLGIDLTGLKKLQALGPRLPPVLVNFPRRADPVIKQVRTLLKDHLSSRPLDCVIRYSKGLIEGASHFVDLLAFLIGGHAVDEVLGPSPLVQLDLTAAGSWFALCEGDGIRLALLENQHDHLPHYSLDILTPGGELRFFHDGRIDWDRSSERRLFPISGPSERWRSRPELSQQFVADEVLNFLTGEPSTLCTLLDAHELHRFIQKVQERTR